MKRFRMYTALLLIIGVLVSIPAQAAYNKQSLGTKSSSDKKWRPTWQVGQKIYGYQIKIKSGHPIVNTVQFNDSDQHKEFTYAQYYNSGDVIERTLNNPMNVGKIKVNMDKAKGCSVELIVYTEKRREEKKHRDTDYDRRSNRDRVGGILDGRSDRDRDRDYDRNSGGRIGQIGDSYGSANYVNLGVIAPGLDSQTVMWFVGGRIQAFEVDMVQGSAKVRTIRLISGNRVLDEMDYNARMESGQVIRERIRDKNITRIELDITNNQRSALRLGVQQ